jgi:hypothetical protein
MNKKLEKQLFDKYPKLFAQKDSSMQETCMCWGICTEDGWYWLIDSLCSCIQNYIDANKKPQVEIVQLKEKFGQMRYYITGADDTIGGMIWLAEDMSYQICEICGSTTDITHTKGWIKTLCKKCAEKETK